ncbi:uncharacterized protein PITG_11770 [Phytophthora infestans T30-4]|uniref:Uncharacterized protein n=1 Tax=Phytophthora infestans (strain T30-4) TaxID=403677 RepID=D0NII0_PHYIT|nr:uncharacterized protein PITG_11770 [Phytophthora infestans T30-4]EEY59265.1 conserved hypothetical protein [Phytophthora infestans T30-4]|eukprot:XP_002901279.1 conserved hypothetical protein [Phytophthora infestans T30-4]
MGDKATLADLYVSVQHTWYDSATESATEYPDNTTAAVTTTAPKDHCDYKSVTATASSDSTNKTPLTSSTSIATQTFTSISATPTTSTSTGSVIVLKRHSKLQFCTQRNGGRFHYRQNGIQNNMLFLN